MITTAKKERVNLQTDAEYVVFDRSSSGKKLRKLTLSQSSKSDDELKNFLTTNGSVKRLERNSKISVRPII